MQGTVLVSYEDAYTTQKAKALLDCAVQGTALVSYEGETVILLDPPLPWCFLDGEGMPAKFDSLVRGTALLVDRLVVADDPVQAVRVHECCEGGHRDQGGAALDGGLV